MPGCGPYRWSSERRSSVFECALELAAPEMVTVAQQWILGAFAISVLVDGAVYRVTDIRRQGLLPEQRRRLRSPFLTAAPLTVPVVVLQLAAWLFG